MNDENVWVLRGRLIEWDVLDTGVGGAVMALSLTAEPVQVSRNTEAK